ncbi:type IV pilus twitching motility protein PilT [uncultured Megamonas sp.]|uniref:type IV pilus twitching motility protein PilT n=1 Tax=uncultured Megamonas sp. TaxID=286140 RepID=UPI0026705BEE|nr:PilT/PilU family type 4a pilus ATPase [uncultured Megamonas sp.]
MEYIKLKKFLEVLQKAIEGRWSDVHLTTNEYIYYRQKSELKILADEIFLSKDFEEIITTILNERQQNIFRSEKVIDFAYEFAKHRFRINIYAIYKGYSLAIRLINDKVKSISEFYQQEILQNILHNDNGLILICGATGTGKSTTLASMIEYLNQNKYKHIITLEEPIEYVFTNKKSLIHQREYHVDFENFSDAIKMAMRQDPDVIMVGEIRDSKTMKACLNAAETGHLVLGTLHASSVVEAIIRMESFFNQKQIEAVSMQIASSLNSIIIQKLVPTLNNDLVCCMDILLASMAVKNLIAKNQLAQLISQMQLSKKMGMQFMRDDILKLIKTKLVDENKVKQYMG